MVIFPPLNSALGIHGELNFPLGIIHLARTQNYGNITVSCLKTCCWEQKYIEFYTVNQDETLAPANMTIFITE